MPAFSGQFNWNVGLKLTNTQALEFDPGGTAYQGLIGRDLSTRQ